MNVLEYLIPFVLALGALIFFHELGHYMVARWCGVKVLRFSVGFGKPLLRWTRGPDRTEWVLAAFPLGGYVKMLDEREAPVPAEEAHRAFNRQTVGRRYAIVAAGPLANFALAIVLYWALFVSGTEELRPRIALVEGESIAAVAGMRDGDLVTHVDDEAVSSWTELRWALLRHAVDKRTVTLQVRSEDHTQGFRQLDLSGMHIDDGEVDLVRRMGLMPWRPHIPPVIGEVMPGSAADRAGLRSGDLIVYLAEGPLDSWLTLVERIRERAGVPTRMAVMRDGERIELELVPDEATQDGQRVGRVGITVAEFQSDRESMFAIVRYGPLESLGRALTKTWDTSVLSLKMIGRMITGDISWKNLSGPVTIADYAGQSAKLGWTHYLTFVALISISLGVLNLLPIPVLDGGHLLYYTIEIIKGGPVSERAMEIGQQIGLVMLAMLMAFAFYNDLTRLFSG